MQKSYEKLIIRVYAIIVHNDKLLLSDEFWYDTPMTKFPGGGLEPGEGVKDCLVRELIEELGTAPSHIEHLYTCENLISSDFVPSTQVIPIYYTVKLKDYNTLDVSQYRYDFKRLENGAIRLRWIPIELFNVDELTFSGDRDAWKVFKEKFNIPNFE